MTKLATHLLHIEKLIIYEGIKRRCRLDGVKVTFSLDEGEQHHVQTTDENGTLGDTALVANEKYTTCRVVLTKTGYKSVGVKVKVIWDGDDGELALMEVFVLKEW